MKTYTPEKKQEAIDRFISGESAAAILADIGIPKSTFYNWVRIYQEEQAELNRKTVDIRNFHLLENKVARLETIIEILKSASCTPKSPLKQRLYAAEQLYGKYNIHVICDAFDIPRGTFYNHVLRNKKDNTWYAKRREELRLQIQEIYDESNQIFGAAKIAAVMKSNGIKVSDEMVRTLMRDMGLVSIRQSAKKLYEDECRKYKNHLNQEFDVSRPNEVWVSDVTYFKYGKSAYYICSLNITQSFSRAYVPYDNSVMESFFSSMKREELYRTKYRSETDFRKSVDEYIIFYNTKRPHRKLQYKTPKQKEEEYALKSAD